MVERREEADLMRYRRCSPSDIHKSGKFDEEYPLPNLS